MATLPRASSRFLLLISSVHAGVESKIGLNQAPHGDRYTLGGEFRNLTIWHVQMVDETPLMMSVQISRKGIIDASNQARHKDISSAVLGGDCLIYLFQRSARSVAANRIRFLWENRRAEAKRLLPDFLASPRLLLKGIQAKSEPSVPRDLDGRVVTDVLYVNAYSQYSAVLAKVDLFLALNERNFSGKRLAMMDIRV